MLRVLFITYQMAMQTPGGGEIQLLKTKEYLERLGLAVKLFDQWTDRFNDYDVVHCFSKHTWQIWPWITEAGSKLIVSPVYWENLPTMRRARRAAARLVRRCTNSVPCSRPWERPEVTGAPDRYCPNSQAEARFIEREWRVGAQNIEVVPNGVDRKFRDGAREEFARQFGIKDFVLCVGRIEPRKNQLGLIRALKGVDIPVVFVGSAFTTFSPMYYSQCRAEAGQNVRFIDHIAHDDSLLASAYKAASVFALPSWYETPGLAALEAALAGTPVVITEGGCTREYFRDFVLYVNPRHISDITAKVLQALEGSGTAPQELRDHVERNFLWEAVADRMFEVYQNVLGD